MDKTWRKRGGRINLWIGIYQELKDRENGHRKTDGIALQYI